MGTRRLYDFVDHNPDVELRPVDYVNNPFVIAQNENMVSINSFVQVDLMGQVASESIGPKQISGVGGQVDFVRGASASKGGVSIMAMPSTVKGKISKIVPLLDEGAAVTTSRNDVDYIVTEYGVAALKGQTLRQRARNLIEIAHPDFRDELKAGTRSASTASIKRHGAGRRPAHLVPRRGIERKRAMTNLEKYDRLFLTAFRVKPEELPGLKYQGIPCGTPAHGSDGDMERPSKSASAPPTCWISPPMRRARRFWPSTAWSSSRAASGAVDGAAGGEQLLSAGEAGRGGHRPNDPRGRWSGWRRWGGRRNGSS